MIKKVAPSFGRLLSSAIKSGSDMHIVVAIAIAETSEMEWEVENKYFSSKIVLTKNEIIYSLIISFLLLFVYWQF